MVLVAVGWFLGCDDAVYRSRQDQGTSTYIDNGGITDQVFIATDGRIVEQIQITVNSRKLP